MNINRDYLIINDVKKSNVKLDNGSMFFYITDKNTQNIFVNLVINVSNNDLIQKYANIENAEDYTLTMNIVKPDNDYKIIEGKLHDKEKAIFEFDLPEDCVDKIGSYRCELLTKCTINGHEEITTSNKLTYKVKSSVLNDLDDIVETPEYPLVIQLFDKLSDIEQYEEDRRANELARQLAEEQRQARFDTLDADMTDSIQAIDNKVVEVENRVSTKEQAVDKLIVDTKADIDNYKVAKDQEIDEYKSAKDTEINETIANQDNKIDTAIANQDNKIDEAISNQNDRIAVVENNDVAQDNRLDVLENKDVLHESRLDAIEVKNQQQDNRLDIVENKNQQQDNRLTAVEGKNVEQDNRLNAIEAIDVAQNTRLDAIEVKNQEQDDRLLDIEKVNKRQDMNLKCLFAESKNNMIDVTEEGNSIYLQNSTTGYTLIDEIKGNTLVNCNKEPDKELILNGNINTSGDNTVTLTEGVDGGLVDVALEGNTLVNVSKTKDSTAITKSYTVKTGNHVALQGEYDGKCRPVVTGNTLVSEVFPFKGSYLSGADCTISNTTQTDDYWERTITVSSEASSSRSCSLYYNVTLSKPLLTGRTYSIIVYNCTQGSDFKEYKLRNNSNNQEAISSNNILTITPTKESSSFGFMVYSNNKEAGENIILKFPKKVIVLEGDYTNKPIPAYFTGLQSSFEDKVVTQEMVDNGEESAENLGKYKVDYVISREDGTVGQTKTFYLNSPLLEGDTIEQQGNNVVHVHRSELRAYETDDELTLPTDMTNTLVAKATPQYEVISQNDTILCDSYTNGHLDVDSVVPVEKVDFLPFKEELVYLYPSTQYAVQFVSNAVSKVDITLGDAKLLNQNVVIGTNKYMITTPSELVHNNLVLNGEGFNASNIVVTEATDQEFGYFEGMKSVGECEDLEVVSSNSDGTLSNTQTLTHEPLRAVGNIKDKYVLIDGKWYIERNCGYRNGYTSCNNSWSNDILINKGLKLFKLDESIEKFDDMSALRKVKSNKFKCVQYGYTDGRFNVPFLAYITENGNLWVSADINYTQQDMLNYIKDCQFVYELPSPTYEPIDYNPFEVYSDVTHISNNSTIPCNMIIKNTGYNCLLKPSTTYTVSSNLGLNTVTTPSVLTEDCLRFYDTDTSTVTTMNNVMVLEGDYTTGKPLPSHFSGIESCFEQEYDEEVGKYKVKIRVQNEDASKENNITFYINEPLRGVGTAKDKVYVKDDKVVVERNCGSATFDGSDDENLNFNRTLDNSIRFDVPYPNISTSRDYTIVCNRFKYATDNSMDSILNHTSLSLFTFYIAKSKLQSQDTAGFKQWLQQNPTTVVYQLAEPIYEEVEYNDVKLFIESFKNSTLFYNGNIPVTSKLWYSYSVPIVDTVAQTEDISNQQDSMIIDLATQVAVMEMMLM